ncbi:hypothetical protein C8R46DRAFT_1118227 [Mycena filopes]|nr:hypothetical protein C8R46DRAFT_1118227 [Mycena filopes]
MTLPPNFSFNHAPCGTWIFKHALTEYDDLTRPYSNEFYYRPGFEFAGRIDTNLLLTCRLIYLETHLAPISLNEHSGSFASDPERYFWRMTPQQRAAVRREGRRAQQLWAMGLTVPKLSITIRHSDWWYWEDHEDLRMQDPSQAMPGLQEIELELETLDEKREQLDQRDGGSLVHDGEEPRKSTRLASSRLGPDHADEYDDYNYSDEEDDSDDSDEDEEDDEEREGDESNGGNQQGAELYTVEEETPLAAELVRTALGEESPDEPADQEDAVVIEDADIPPALSSEAALDRNYPINMKLHVQRLRFVHERLFPSDTYEPFGTRCVTGPVV